MFIKILFICDSLSLSSRFKLHSKLLTSPSSFPSVTVRRRRVDDFRRLFRFRAHAITIRRELNEQNSVIFRRNERRPIRARKAKRQAKRERTRARVQIDLNDGETRGCYSRHLHLYGVSSEHCAVREGPQCVSSVTEIAGERRSWLVETGVARLASTEPQTPR